MLSDSRPTKMNPWALVEWAQFTFERRGATYFEISRMRHIVKLYWIGWYGPHHTRLERKVNDVIARLSVCLIVDCHSFSSIPLPHEPDQTADRPDFCVGTDPFHTPAAIRDAIVAATEDEGYSIGIDAPFAGALVPLPSYHKDRRILSAMIEVNRRLYYG